MRRLLQHVADARERILIVSPRLKLSLVRPFLLALPNRNIELTVVTDFNVKAIRRTSDLQGLEILLQRPTIPGVTRIFRMTSWHEQVFVFDDQFVLWNCDREEARVLAVKLWEREKILAQQVLAAVKAQFSTSEPIHKETLKEMRSLVLNHPDVLASDDLGPNFRELDIIKLDAPVGFDPQDAADLRLTAPLEELALRDIAIEEFAEGLESADLNKLAGIRFESPNLSWSEPVQLVEAARRDIARIRDMSIHSLGLKGCSIDAEAVITPFVHQS
jgi:hypothetical protein